MPLASNFTAFSHRFHIQFRINLASNLTTSRSGARRIFSFEHWAPDIGRTPGTGHQAPAPGTGHRAAGAGHRAPGSGRRAPGAGNWAPAGQRPRHTTRKEGRIHFASVRPSLGRTSPHSRSHAASLRLAQHRNQSPAPTPPYNVTPP